MKVDFVIKDMDLGNTQNIVFLQAIGKLRWLPRDEVSRIRDDILVVAERQYKQKEKPKSEGVRE